MPKQSDISTAQANSGKPPVDLISTAQANSGKPPAHLETSSVRIRTRSERQSTLDLSASNLFAGSSASSIAPEDGTLVDEFGRVHDDLRISVTDKCNYRCVYCMPEDGMEFLARKELLSYEEILQALEVAKSLGIKSVRISGGEPLMRRNLMTLVAMISDLGIEDISLTTNGHFLGRQAQDLHKAGLSRVNISCDSLVPDKFARIRKGGELARVLESADVAQQVGISPVKINVVVMKGINDDEIEQFCEYGRRNNRIVRFIEFMPLDAEGKWSFQQVVPGEKIVERVNARWPIEAVDEAGPSHAPALRYRYLDGMGEIGVISSVTKPFCGSCNRLRLTADGNLRNCLFAREELSIREILRSDSSIEDIQTKLALAFRLAVSTKKAGHGIGSPDFIRPNRSMSMIGG